MLQEQNIDKLTEAFVDRTKEVCPSLLADARATATRYNTLLKLYAKCDNLFNRGDFLTQEEIHSLGEFICVHKLTHYMYYSMSKEQHKLTSKWSNICLFLLAFIRIDKFIPKKGMEDRLNLSVICYLRSLGNVKCWRPRTQFNCFFFYSEQTSQWKSTSASFAPTSPQSRLHPSSTLSKTTSSPGSSFGELGWASWVSKGERACTPTLTT